MHDARLYLCIFPTAFFFFVGYNESLFLSLTAGAFLAMHRQCWWLAGILGMLAALTRSAGLFLVIPYLWEVWISRESITAARQKWLLRLLTILLIPQGTTIYALYCWNAWGNPLAFAAVQSHWATVVLALVWHRALSLPAILESAVRLVQLSPRRARLERHRRFYRSSHPGLA